MWNGTVFGVELSFSIGFPAVVALLCFFDKTGSAALCLYAAMLHEVAHIAAAVAAGFRPRSLTFGAFGMRMELPPLPYRLLAAVALAGPLCNLLFAALSAAASAKLGVTVHLALGLFNLLPLRPLDGGQALFCALAPRFGEVRTQKAMVWIEAAVVLSLLYMAGAVFFRSGYNVSLAVLCGYLVFFIFFKKKD